MNTNSSLFSGTNAQAQGHVASNIFIAQPKPGSLFSGGLSLNANNNININSVNNENKTEAINGSISIGSVDKQQNKSLLNDKNPFLQKTNIAQNNLFTSNFHF